MDCADLCRFIAWVEDDRIVKLEPDPHHPVTKGFSCKKGRNLVTRMGHPDRIRHPLIKKNGQFVQASYDAVFKTISDKLWSIKQEFGTQAVLNYTSDGYAGIKNRIQNIFFNCFGGVTQAEGSLCWGAGIAAQTYDFGSARGHFPDDVLNARTILVWGRNPKLTSLHLYTLLKQARKNGSRVIVIDPVKTATAKAFDDHIRIRPSTDGALALAMARSIIEKNLHDTPFIEKYVLGFNRFKASVASFTPEKAEAITGIRAGEIENLALTYAGSETASIYIGFGMQRYGNGGNAVRCIDALAAITGNIGKKGCGANYAAKSLAPYLSDLERKSESHAGNRRRFIVGKLGEFLSDEQDPPIKAIFVAGGNPLTQSPDLAKTVENFSRIEFKVVFDHFMTDTARHADIVIPAAFVFEQEDLFATSMYSPVVNASQKAVEPPEKLMSEFEFYLQLAQKMGLKNLGFKDSEDYLEKSARPLLDRLGEKNILWHGRYLWMEKDDIAWEDKVFETPSGKIEIYSETAQKEGMSPLPVFIEPEKGSAAFPLRLLTCHTMDSMHSQGFAFTDALPRVFVNRKTAEEFAVQGQSHVYVRGRRAKLEAILCLDEAICDGTAFIYQGFWHKSGAVNFLTNDAVSDMGKQAAYYDSFCAIEKIS